ncbi:hypothetical protein CBL_11228 [Carabus blaptoides fortunei]
MKPGPVLPLPVVVTNTERPWTKLRMDGRVDKMQETEREKPSPNERQILNKGWRFDKPNVRKGGPQVKWKEACRGVSLDVERAIRVRAFVRQRSSTIYKGLQRKETEVFPDS